VKVSRRTVLKGIGGATLALPLLESVGRGTASAAVGDPFAIFLRQANGVGCEQNTGEIGAEPERFWPRSFGPLDAANVAGRALDELMPHLSRLLVVKNVNMMDFDYGDGHARGALQGLTGRGPTVAAAGGDSEAAGESLDHRIGAELNPEGRDSLFLYASSPGGWLGGPCISYRGPGARRAATHNPWNAYMQLMGASGGLTPEVQAQLVGRHRSVNDLVRAQLGRLLGHPRLSGSDRRRLDQHLSNVRDLEVSLTCGIDADRERMLEGESAGFASAMGDDIIRTVQLHMQVAAIAVGCGFTRSVAIQVGSGNDGASRFRDQDTGDLMENFHYISHRRLSHDSSGSVIAGSDLLHHKIDRHFGAMFRYLLDRLTEVTLPGGMPLIDTGVAVWYNDNGNGPGHSPRNSPWILAGSAGGQLRQGQYVEAMGSGPTHTKMLNTIGSVVGLRNAAGGPLDDFGDPSLPRGVMSELLV
jgi:hypothetical protein